MKTVCRFIGAALLAGTACAFAVPAGAAGFPAKDITFIIPYGPGGGFDTYVRKIAPVMQRHLPNKVNVVPKNIDGAGGNKAAAQLFRATPDGYQIAIFNMPGMLLDKILGRKAAFDIDKFEWLGRIAQSKYVLAVRSNGEYKTVQDLINSKKTLKYAITSPASTSYVAGKIMADILGMKIDFLPGYKSSAKISLSVVRGDTQLSLFNVRSLAKWMKSGELKPVLSFERKSPFKGTPTAAEIGKPALEMLTIDRVVGTTPGVKSSVQKILSDALFAALKDKEIQDWHKKSRQPIDPLSGPETKKMLEASKVFYSKYKDVLKTGK